MLSLLLTAVAAGSTIAIPPGSLILQEKGWATIQVDGITLPPFDTGEAGNCTVVLGLPMEGGITAVATECDTPFAYRSQQATLDWTAEAIDRDFYEQTAMLSIQYVYTGDEVRVFFDEKTLRSPLEDRPSFVDTASFDLIKTVVPRYPKELIGSEQGATCVVRARVLKSGRPTDLEPLSCPDAFQDSASRAIKRWRWAPPTTNGERVVKFTRVTVTFKPQ